MEREFKRIVSEKMHGYRLDHYLILSGIGVSRNRVVKLIEAGAILVNQKIPKPSYRVKPGDDVFAKLVIENEIDALPEPMDLNIVFEDDELIVLDKPKGAIVIRPGVIITALWSMDCFITVNCPKARILK